VQLEEGREDDLIDPALSSHAMGDTTTMTTSLTDMKAALNDEVKDLRLNLDNVLRGDKLTAEQAAGVALSSAYFLRDRALVEALRAENGDLLSPSAVADAQAAAAIMGMNTVYYRFRHMIGKASYETKPAGLRMARMARPATSKAQFELNSMACAALAGCQMCVQSHEASLLKEGMTEDQVHESVRIAAVVAGFVIARDASIVS
jgi:alkyl hydroperoxide reductase subunit D